jgi:Fic/DOC family
VNTKPDLPRAEVAPLPGLNGGLRSVLDSVDSLQRAWKAVVSANDVAFQEARRRSLRRHAIETGIIERLYEVDWGVTEALVAEGITADAVARAAWLHHLFVRIHPFEDGNGRVARCLTLLNLLRCDLAPLVVDRRERDRYLRTLDQANEGDLRPLIRFFAELEIVALRSELERPVEEVPEAIAGGALGVLQAGVARLRRLQTETGAQDRAMQVQAVADRVHVRIGTWLDSMRHRIEQQLGEAIPSHSGAGVDRAAPPDARARHWARQVVQTARKVDFFCNRRDGVWWQRLRVHALGQELRYLVFLQKVGRGETGVLTMTVYAELMGDEAGEDTRQEAETVLISSPTETVTWTYDDAADSRWQDVVEILDTTLASALHTFMSALG